MTTVEQAEQIILAQTKSYGTESIYFENALGRVLAEDIKADRDLPPYDRVTMDGIAIGYAAFEKGIRCFKIAAIQAAGDVPVDIKTDEECIEIMTGAALPPTTDTVIRYEDVAIKNGVATVTTGSINKAQNIHLKGKDRSKGQVVANAGMIITPALISMAASVGKTELLVKKLPSVVIISSGDEVVDVNETPGPYQIRRSNGITIKAALRQYRLHADLLHIPDDADITRQQIEKCLTAYDVILLSGGISMGKFDHIPQVLEDLNVKKLFHKVAQRPGKPFWFGKHDNGVLVFAFPGNPVSTFMCLQRYFCSWLQGSLGIAAQRMFAVLDQNFAFAPALQYFLQVKLTMDENGRSLARPIMGNGSGDLANLLDTDAFMELPLQRDNFTKGEVFRIWPFSSCGQW